MDSAVKKKILVVEDEAPLQKAIQAKLELGGYDVRAASTVDTALSILHELGSVDLIWLDHYLMGTKDGLDFVFMLKSGEQWKHIPIFLVSNTASPDKVTSYMSLGVDKYYLKADCRLDDILNDVREKIGV